MRRPKLELPPGAVLAADASPTQSPAPSPLRSTFKTDDDGPSDTTALIKAAGCQPHEVYVAALPAWRARLRYLFIQNLDIETAILARLQVSRRLLLGLDSPAD